MRARPRLVPAAVALALVLTAAGATGAAAGTPAAAASTGSAGGYVPDRDVARMEPGPGGTAPTPVPVEPTRGASSLQDQGTWDYVRLLDQGLVINGLEPARPSTPLSRLAADRALALSEAGTATTDPALAGLLPPGWTDGQQAVYRAVEYDPASAARVLADAWLHDDWLDQSAPAVTDVGVALVERPGQRDQKQYTLVVIGAAYPHSAAQAGESTLYRFARPGTGTHFYSTSEAERDAVIADPAFRYEGPVAYVLRPSVDRPGTSPLHRFSRPVSGTHFYTATRSEHARVLGFPQYVLDGLAGAVYTGGGGGRVPMYRFYRPASGTHFYTASAAEAERVRQMPGYTFEGTAFYLRRAT